MQPQDRVRLTLTSRELHHEIWVPFMTVSQLTPERVMVEVERVVQSNETWLFGEFFLKFIHAPLPGGGDWLRSAASSLARYLESRRCFIQIKNKDRMCCARAIVTAKARVDNHREWNNIRQGRHEQYLLAKELHNATEVPEDRMCGREEWVKFQGALGEDYQLKVVSRDFFNAIVYEGPEAEKRLYIYCAENHYTVITSMPSFVERHYYCHPCNVGYNTRGAHVCKNGCNHCQAPTACHMVAWKGCNICNRFFKSDICYENHLTSRVCSAIKACPICGQVYRTYRMHECGMVYCKVCRDSQPLDHQCYMKPLKGGGSGGDEEEEEEEDEEEEEMEEVDREPVAKKRKKKKIQLYIFYDFEAMLVEKRHVPNLCVAHKVCTDCLEEPMDVPSVGVGCPCKRVRRVFKGETTLQEFGDWLFSGKHKGAICIAHNSQAYDAHLLLEYAHESGLQPTMIENGRKIMSMELCGLRFIDSLNYFNTGLAKLPKMFGLQELHKGYFPHLFSTPQNQTHKGNRHPDASFYDPEGMSASRKEAFEVWYEANKDKEFDYQAELLKYCTSDVDILHRSCGCFRSIFMEIAANIDPFERSFTIASACNRVYRSLFLEPGQIAIIPPQGYGKTDNQSAIALCWLDWIAETEGVLIQHAMNGGERRLAGVKVDGFDEESNTVYEFQGCFYHGHEVCYARESTVNPVNGLTMGELREKTRRKTTMLAERGYRVVEKWECDFRTEIQTNPALKDFYTTREPYFPLHPRDAFFGGRTNAIRLHCEASVGSPIRYVDFTSLYPWVCKYGIFPLGHPTVHYTNNTMPERVEGLMRCKVLPPTRLFHPVLPARINGKLLFSLCRSCAETRAQETCAHSDEERAFTGTWVTLELDKAVEMGYRILERYSAWHFETTTQLDPVTGDKGLWSECMDLWLKIKQEASGYPAPDLTEEEKRHYIEDYELHEGVKLDPPKIEKNEGKRSLGKLMLNSHWGKFGQNPDKKKVVYVSDPADYVRYMTDASIEVSDLRYANKEHVALTYSLKGEFVESLPNTNVVLAAYTTAQARLKLYTLLEGLQERVLYMDTDSVIYIHDEEKWNPELGPYLGELKDETEGVAIQRFVSGGAKNYAYQLENGSEVCKIRGFTLNSRNARVLNFRSMRDLVVTTPERRRQASLVLTDPHKIVRRDHLYTEEQKKAYKVVYDKRRLMADLTTLPYGWKEEV